MFGFDFDTERIAYATKLETTTSKGSKAFSPRDDDGEDGDDSKSADTPQVAVNQVLYEVIAHRLGYNLPRAQSAKLYANPKEFLLADERLTRNTFDYLFPCTSVRFASTISPMAVLACAGQLSMMCLDVFGCMFKKEEAIFPHLYTYIRNKAGRHELRQKFDRFVTDCRYPMVMAIGALDNPYGGQTVNSQNHDSHACLLILHKTLDRLFIVDPNGSDASDDLKAFERFGDEIATNMSNQIPDVMVIGPKEGPQSMEITGRIELLGENFSELDSGGWCVMMSHAMMLLLYQNWRLWAEKPKTVAECTKNIEDILTREFRDAGAIYKYMLMHLMPAFRRNMALHTTHEEILDVLMKSLEHGVNPREEIHNYPTETERLFGDIARELTGMSPRTPSLPRPSKKKGSIKTTGSLRTTTTTTSKRTRLR